MLKVGNLEKAEKYKNVFKNVFYANIQEQLALLNLRVITSVFLRAV